MTACGFGLNFSNSRADIGSQPRGASRVRVIPANRPPTRQRAQGRPGAGWRPRSACSKKHAAEPQAQPRSPGLPCAMVYGLYALSPGTGVLAPVAVRSSKRRRLDLSTGRPGPHDFTVLSELVVRSRMRAAIPIGHRISGPALVTIAKRPSWQGRDAGECEVDLPDGARGFFATSGGSPAIRLKELRNLVGLSSVVMARSVSDEAIQTASPDRFWIASLRSQ